MPVDEISQNVSNGINQGPKRPEYLYKYRSLADPSRSYTERIFLHKKIYFAKPSELLDPFECQCQLDTYASPSTITKAVNRCHNHQPLPDIRGTNKWLQNEDPQKGDIRINQVFARRRKTTGIFCLSEENRDILMWSHYADAHRGICIEFNIQHGLAFWSNLLCVEYKNEFPVINAYGTDPWAKIQKFALTKASHWKYEKEWRVITMKESELGEQKLPKRAISGVIFGCEITNKNRAYVKSLISKYSANVRLYEARKKRNSYAVEIVEVYE